MPGDHTKNRPCDHVTGEIPLLIGSLNILKDKDLKILRRKRTRELDHPRKSRFFADDHAFIVLCRGHSCREENRIVIILQNRGQFIRGVQTIQRDRYIVLTVAAGTGACHFDNIGIVEVKLDNSQKEPCFKVELGKDPAFFTVFQICEDVGNMKAQSPKKLIEILRNGSGCAEILSDNDFAFLDRGFRHVQSCRILLKCIVKEREIINELMTVFLGFLRNRR